MMCGASVVLDRGGILNRWKQRFSPSIVFRTVPFEFEPIRTMASLLLTGDPAVVSSFASGIAGDHTLYCWLPEGAAEGGARGMTYIESPDALPGPVDAAFILTVRDDGELESALTLLDEVLSGGGVPLFVNTLFLTATEISSFIGGRSPVIGISFVPGLTGPESLLEAAPALQTSEEAAARGLELLGSVFPGAVERVEDRIALVTARIFAMIANEAAFALMEGVADVKDIDTAMKLGTNYPKGPLAWVDEIGADVIAGILHALFEEYGEERYRPCVLLKQYARAGKKFYSEPA